jgi:2-polyprenyl-6-hydroxyphenyl methylase/3-demethylubiquinone-9 3-methyltransferase
MKWSLAQRFEIKWWQNYLKNQDVKEYLNRKKAYWQKIRSLCPFELNTSDRLLDAGCGPAGIFTILNAQQVDAIDPLLDKYEKTLAHFSQSAYPDVQFYQTRLEDFVPSIRYDSVFCLNAINHVHDISLAMKTLSLATGKDKWLVLSIDTHKWSVLKWLFRFIPLDILHPHQHDLKEYKKMLQKEQFEVIQAQKLKNGLIFDYHIIFAQKRGEF